MRAYAGRAGLRFEAIGNFAKLAAQVTAADEVMLFADGVLPDAETVRAQLAERSGVLAFPAEAALPLGFERIDASRGWSGVLRARGDCVARLAELPADCDLASTLLRIVLQAGTPIRDLEPSLLAEGRWRHRVDRFAIEDAERAWISRQVRLAPFTAPGRALSERAGLALALRAAGGRWARAPHIAGMIGLAGGAAAALAAWPLAGLASLLLASAAFAIARVFDHVESLGGARGPSARPLAIAGLIGDGLLVALLAHRVITVPGWIGYLLPTVLLGLLHLGSRYAPLRVRLSFADRISLLMVLISMVAAGYATAGVAALLVLVLAALLWNAPRGDKGITAD